MGDILILFGFILFGAVVIGVLIYFYVRSLFNLEESDEENSWFTVKVDVVDGKQKNYRKIQFLIIALSLLLIVRVGGMLQIQDYPFLQLNSIVAVILYSLLVGLISNIIKIVAWKKETVQVEESELKKLMPLTFIYAALLITVIGGAYYIITIR
ncbi:hypothetical protein PRVXH_000821 [Proteinivorax hydrogeniformans]|uniref:Uncharacterized protein n=1 Tax=Proteinivorax hydrogeniformans TaxID=1826727 RepID=A0AAU8HVR4_9FIRM